MVQWIKGVLGALVRSPTQHSGLGIWGCCSCGLGCNCGSDLIPGPEAPHATGKPKKKKKKKRKKEKKRKEKRKGSILPKPCYRQGPNTCWLAQWHSLKLEAAAAATPGIILPHPGFKLHAGFLQLVQVRCPGPSCTKSIWLQHLSWDLGSVLHQESFSLGFLQRLRRLKGKNKNPRRGKCPSTGSASNQQPVWSASK